MRKSAALAIVGALMGLQAACSESPITTTDDDPAPVSPPEDAGNEVPVVDAAVPDVPPVDVDAGPPAVEYAHSVCDWDSTARLGTEVGDKLQGFDLTRCDGSGFRIPRDLDCNTRLIFFLVSAGWCGPCIRETMNLMEDLVEPYAARGLRVVQILLEDDEYHAPSQDYCEEWPTTYGLSNMDVVTDRYDVSTGILPATYIPSAALVDGSGLIRWVEIGAAGATETLSAEIDRLLPPLSTE